MFPGWKGCTIENKFTSILPKIPYSMPEKKLKPQNIPKTTLNARKICVSIVGNSVKWESMRTLKISKKVFWHYHSEPISSELSSIQIKLLYTSFLFNLTQKKKLWPKIFRKKKQKVCIESNPLYMYIFLSLCEKDFIDRNTLISHMTAHTGEKHAVGTLCYLCWLKDIRNIYIYIYIFFFWWAEIFLMSWIYRNFANPYAHICNPTYAESWSTFRRRDFVCW